MPVPHYDLAVIGSGPAGQKGAIAAAKLRKRVAVIDRRDMVGGCSLHLGTIPSKTMREAILYLTGIRQRTFYGADYRAKEDRCTHVASIEMLEAIGHEELPVYCGAVDRLPAPGGDNEPRQTSDELDTPWTLALCGTTASATDATRVSTAAGAATRRPTAGGWPGAAAG